MSKQTPEQLAEVMRHGAEQVGRSFTRPDDDWAPVAVVLTGDSPSLVQFVLPNDSERWKDVHVAAMVDAVRRLRARALVTVMSAWTVDATAVDPATLARLVAGKMHVRDLPSRAEVLTVTLYEPTGMRMWVAEIDRSDGPPTLGSWNDQGYQATGRYVEPILTALARVAAPVLN